MKRPIPDSTGTAILAAAWDLMEGQGRPDISMAEIAAAAGVSRQTLHLAFGSRAGLLLAMVRHKDTRTDHVARMAAFRDRPVTPESFLQFLGVWLDYLPVVYPVAIQLDAAAITDPEAAEAIGDRMKAALLSSFRRQVQAIAAAGRLKPGASPDHVAEAIWSLVHPQAWRLLVADCGWTPEAFRADRLARAADAFA